MKKIFCYKCNFESSYSERLSFREECANCGEDLHICLNCEFYDLKSYNECRETQAERVAEKSRANRCDYFDAKKEAGMTAQDKAAALRAAAEALFKKR